MTVYIQSDLVNEFSLHRATLVDLQTVSDVVIYFSKTSEQGWFHIRFPGIFTWKRVGGSEKFQTIISTIEENSSNHHWLRLDRYSTGKEYPEAYMLGAHAVTRAVALYMGWTSVLVEATVEQYEFIKTIVAMQGVRCEFLSHDKLEPAFIIEAIGRPVDKIIALDAWRPVGKKNE